MRNRPTYKHHWSVPTSSSSQMLEPCAKRCKKMTSKPRSSSTESICISHWCEGALPPTNRKRVYIQENWLRWFKMECSLYKSNQHPDIVSITRSVWSVQWSHQQLGQGAQLCPQTTAGVERSTGWLHDPGPALFTGVLPSGDSSWSLRSGELRSITPSTLLTKLPLLISEEIVYCPDNIIKLRRAWIHPLQLNQPSLSWVFLSLHVNTCININVQDVYSMRIRSV